MNEKKRVQFIAMAVLLCITGVLSHFSIASPYNLHFLPFWAALVLLGYTCKLLRVFDRLKGMAAWISGVLAAVASKQIEDIGVNVSKLAFLGSYSIYLYMYHVFIAWLICRFTGFSMRYDPETVTTLTLEKSILLALVSIVISILISVLAADKG